MRTTITLDNDVVVLIEEVRRKRRVTFKQAINDGLRQGLVPLPEQRRKKSYTHPVHLGKLLIDNVDCIGEVLNLHPDLAS